MPVLSVLIFCVCGLLLLPYPGLQNDELFFSGPIFAKDAAFYNIEIGRLKIPAMVMSYTGALKTWLYMALFQIFRPGVWSVRAPVLLMGMATIWLTWDWVRRIAGERAAAVAAILLATDTMFLMTDLFDWGPVALQHILLMSGLVAFQRWLDRNSRRWLAGAFFLWGLGMWDKALLIWPLIGLAVAAVCVYPRQVLRRMRPAPALTAAAAFLVGALPLVWYNVARRGETASANAKFSFEDVGYKTKALRATIDGSVLFGYVVYKNTAPIPRRPPLPQPFGMHRKNWMLPAYALGVILFAGLFRSRRWRLMTFLLVTCGVAWLQMALNRGTGGAPHHTILIWPFPVAFLGIAFAEASARLPRFGGAALACVVAFLAIGNLLTTNEYLREFATNGGTGGWTDAIEGLSHSVAKNSGVAWYGLVDWGYLNALRMYHKGDLPLFLVALDQGPDEIKREVEAPDRVFIQHTEDKQMFPGVNDKLRTMAGNLGYEERVERVIRDRNGRPVFELVRFEKAR